MNSKDAYEDVVRRYMKALAACDLEGLSSLFTADAKVYSPLLGWVEPSKFFEKMCRLSDLQASWQKAHNTLISCEDKPAMVKHFTYHWALKDGRSTTFEVCDVFEFNEFNQIVRETILYDTCRLREDMGGNPLLEDDGR